MIRYLFLISFLTATQCYGFGSNAPSRFINADETPPEPYVCTPTLQDFTTYTEKDDYNRLSKTSTVITITGSTGVEAYIRKDFTSAPFSGDFTVLFDWNKTASQDWAIQVGFALAKSTGIVSTLATTDDLIYVYNRKTTTDNYIRLFVVENGVSRYDQSVTLSIGTEYFLELERDDTGGTNYTGLYTLTIRSGSQSGTVVDTLSLSSSAGEQNDFTYLYAFDSFKDLTRGYTTSGTIKNYTVCK